ncbi:Oxidoreductase family protein [Paraburkholderia unamae]|uniref:oxidoreductase-like domain-containing protein n=1 Tax=Paraburkholderia unamae TaxID=219649 RepID=UPI001CAD09F2|nr:oxidoreductase-like domain-containing protein [Paraburkholderia unamae]CAG9260792.1 Oxidoreductase family protein [Paraburkholderia unamae]
MPAHPRPDDDPRPQPPECPNNDDCCHSGCDPCIFDLYDEEYGRYRTALAAWEAREAERQTQVAAKPAAGAASSAEPPHGKASRQSH